MDSKAKGLNEMSGGNELSTLIERINALRDQLFRPDLNGDERDQIGELVAHWRMRLALLLQGGD